MIVLDTNVISEAMKPEPNPAVRTWLNEQVAETLYLTSVTLAEILFGNAGTRTVRYTDCLEQLRGTVGVRHRCRTAARDRGTSRASRRCT